MQLESTVTGCVASTRALARAAQCERSVQGDRGDGAETAMDLNRPEISQIAQFGVPK